MNTIQFSCAGNCFTKPFMCWGLLDVLVVIVVPILVVAIVVGIIYGRKYK